MNHEAAALMGAIVLAIVVIIFLFRFRHRVRFKLKTLFGEAWAEGSEKRTEDANSGVHINNAEVGRDITAISQAAGGISINKVKAKGNLSASHVPPANLPPN